VVYIGNMNGQDTFIPPPAGPPISAARVPILASGDHQSPQLATYVYPVEECHYQPNFAGSASSNIPLLAYPAPPQQYHSLPPVRQQEIWCIRAPSNQDLTSPVPYNSSSFLHPVPVQQPLQQISGNSYLVSNSFQPNAECYTMNQSQIQLGMLNRQPIEAGQEAVKLDSSASCPICSKILKSNLHVQRHIQQIHQSEATNFCPECNKAFKRSENLKCHMRVHSGEKPFECSICTRKFRFQSGINCHMRKIHGKEFP